MQVMFNSRDAPGHAANQESSPDAKWCAGHSKFCPPDPEARTIGEPIVITVTANSAGIGSVVCSRFTEPGKSHEPMTGYMPCPALKARHQRARTSPRPPG